MQPEKFNVSFAGWILSALTFVLGVIVPFVYGKFTYDGISVRPLDNIRSVSGYRDQPVVHFSTLLKVANATKESVMIDGVDSPGTVDIPGFSLTSQRIELKLFAPGEAAVLPPSHPQVILEPDGYAVTCPSLQPVFRDFLPVIVKSNEDKLLGVTFYFTYSGNALEKVVDELGRYLEQKGLPIKVKINGKYRGLKVSIPPGS
jgi:hypothetical protein